MKNALLLILLVLTAVVLVAQVGESPRPDLSFLTPEARAAFTDAKFAPLGKPTEPSTNRTTPIKAGIGRLLYFDPRLSADGTVSCASCHDPEKAWADGEKTAIGIHGQRGPRNSPTVLDSAFYTHLFWDSRAGSLEEQALGPVQNPVEMGNKLPDMVAALNKIADYKPLFRVAFGSDGITVRRVAQALAAFERTLVSGPSAFDRFLAGDSAALDAQQKRGLQTFLGNGECVMCHRGPFLTNELRLAGIRVPTLRNVALTAPYFNDGSAATIDEAVTRRGPKSLTAAERTDLVAFLKSLSGQLPEIGPPGRLPE